MVTLLLSPDKINGDPSLIPILDRKGLGLEQGPGTIGSLPAVSP